MMLHGGRIFMKTKKLFIFDMGNVLIKNIDVSEGCMKAIGPTVDLGDFLKDYRHYEFPLMDGVMTDKQYWEHFQQTFGVKIDGDPIEENFFPEENTEVLSLVKQLRKEGNRVVLGTNTNAEHFNIVKAMGLFENFDRVYASHIMHCSKPLKVFYQKILKEENTLPQDAFFIDDMEENTKQAEKMGIKSFIYQGDNELLQKFLFKPENLQ